MKIIEEGVLPKKINFTPIETTHKKLYGQCCHCKCKVEVEESKCKTKQESLSDDFGLTEIQYISCPTSGCKMDIDLY